MSRFVQGERVPVTEGGDTIYILPKMNFAQREQARDAVRHVTAVVGEEASVELNLGAYRIALLKINVVAWSGPSFDGMPCTAQNIERLDPDDPLLEKVMDELTERNPIGGRRTPTGEFDNTPLAPTKETEAAGIDPLPAPSGADGDWHLTDASNMETPVPGTPMSYSPTATNGLTPSPRSVTPTS